MPATNTATIGRAIGAASLTFGVFDTLMAAKLGRGVGAGAGIFRAAGLREIATGVAGLARPASSAPVWTRFAADIADLATLGIVAVRPNPRRKMALLAIGIVAAVAAADLLAARAIDRRNSSGS